MNSFLDFVWIVLGSMTGLILGSYMLKWIDEAYMAIKRRKRTKSK